MQPLDPKHRRILEKTVQDARDTAEAAARAVLDQLGVGDGKSPAHLDEARRDLRRRLRIHGRQLGDSRDPLADTQEIDRLAEEIAYEHWHRMLFARFLAENQLLMYPDPVTPVAVTLEECAELAADEGAANGWELAARFAGRMLPQIFRPVSPLLDLNLPPERQQHLERLVATLPPETFHATDSLGWVYQFWQAKRKDEVNASGDKIGARQLPAVTQLFTEPYMVGFLLDNALGAWWAARRLGPADLHHAASEEALRHKAALPGVPLTYLRFVREDGAWQPAAGTFDAWPDRLADLKLLDPCCGSGHFLVSALLMLVPLRMELDGLSARAAVDAVLRDNLHGLELDQRCVELAAFALAFAAWTYPGAGAYRPLPELNLACSGLSVSVAKAEWKQLGLGKHNLSLALDWLHDTFQHAPTLGSLLNPARTEAARLARWDDLSTALDTALHQEGSDERQEAAVVAHGLARAAALLTGPYQWVITNVPYLARGKQDDTLKAFCEKHYPEAKNDLATVFLERCLELCASGGVTSVVLPQNWLFLTSYKKFREKLLRRDTWNLIARLGPGAFETISGEVVKAILIAITRGAPAGPTGGLFGEAAAPGWIRGVDVSEPRTAGEKAALLPAVEVKSVEQAKQLENPDARVALIDSENVQLLEASATFHNGLQTGDQARFVAKFWEVLRMADSWSFYQSSVPRTLIYGGREGILNWVQGHGALAFSKGAVIRGTGAWNKRGVSISAMGALFTTSYDGSLYDENTVSLIPKDDINRVSLWAFCSSPSFNVAVRRINQALKVRGDLIKVPFDLDRWTRVAEERYPHGLPLPYTNDPTQWIFHGHPSGSVVWDDAAKWTNHGTLRADETVLQVAVARLLGYRWLAEEQRAWVNRCAALVPFADRDGIVCLPPVRGEASAADRLLNLLAAAYGEGWSNAVLAELLASAGHAGKTLESWLRESFFTQHCKLFQQRPFIWHLWDGLRDGFAALVNYHKLDRKNLETLIYTYLGDWITRQKQDATSGVGGAPERLAAAEVLKQRLELILEGEDPYDIFVRWKPLEQQPIGWEPDLNDGVRLNIRPFLSVPDVGKKGAGILRDKPNLHWNKDRGKDVESAPWYAVFGGDRINDHHLTLVEKKAAR